MAETVLSDFAERSGAALVTGGTGGIGAAIVRMLAERGSDVAFTFRNNFDAAAALTDQLASTGRTALSIRADLEEEMSAIQAVTETIDKFGGLHTLVYSSGPHVPMVHLSKVSPTKYRRQLETDACAFFNLVHAALPALRNLRATSWR